MAGNHRGRQQWTQRMSDHSKRPYCTCTLQQVRQRQRGSPHGQLGA
jgi:hypothetical protein